MSQHLNLLSRRIAADAFEASKGDPAKTVAAVEKDPRLEGATKDEKTYVKTRVELWSKRWKDAKIVSPTALAEDSNLAFDGTELPPVANVESEGDSSDVG